MIGHIEKAIDVKASPFSDLGSAEGVFGDSTWLCGTVVGRTEPCLKSFDACKCSDKEKGRSSKLNSSLWRRPMGPSM